MIWIFVVLAFVFGTFIGYVVTVIVGGFILDTVGIPPSDVMDKFHDYINKKRLEKIMLNEWLSRR